MSSISRGPMLSRRAFTLFAVATMTLAGCGTETEKPLPKISEGTAPAYYPAGYRDIIEGSKHEGRLTVLGNTDQENWVPILRDFKRKYPWTADVSVNNLDSDEIFQRVRSENATGDAKTDLLVSNASGAWVEYAADAGAVLDYTSPEAAKLPEFASLLPGVYAMSTEAMVMAYNSQLLDQNEYPTGLASLAKAVAANQDKFRGKITTRDVTGSFGFTGSYGLVDARPDAWRSLETILPEAKPESSSGTQLDKVLSGEYLVGFFVSTGNGYNAAKKSGGLLELTYLDDGTPVLPRGIGINGHAKNPNTAKLFLDFVLSQEGQQSLVQGGGLTAMRAGTKAGEGEHTYEQLVAEVGEKNVIMVRYEQIPDAARKEFQSRWNGLLGKSS